MTSSVRLVLAPLLLLGAVAGCGDNPVQPPPVAQPPSIVCPAAINVTGGPQAVTYPAPAVTGGAQPVTATCTPPSGTPFPVGATQVTCVASDVQSRQASCSFAVTVSAVQFAATKYMAFGDSITWGENGRPGAALRFQPFQDLAAAYPTQLAEMLQAFAPEQGIVVINEGKPGERVTESLPRFTAAVLGHAPGAVLLLEGINDVKAETIPPSRIVAALRDNIRTARDRGVQFVFVSTLLPGKPGRREPPEQNVVATNALIRPMVTTMAGAYLVDPYDRFLAQRDTYIDDDGLHLTPAGNRALAEAFLERIKSVMAANPAAPLARGR